nr:helix-turn-helix transcriptional regulator [Solirubrobacterales bacterium]
MADQRLVNSGAQRDLTAGGRRRRTDAEQNRVRILEAAESVLRADSEASVQQIADAAGVSRTTLHRHFRSRSELEETVRRQVREDSDANEEDFLRPAGELADTAPSPIDVIAVLNKVPPHLLGEQIVAEAQRIAGVSSVALYVVDIDGSHLLRLAGSLEYPEQIRVPLAVGPELPREGVPGLRELLDEDLPGCVSAPMYLRGRAVGVLLATQAPEAPLDELARQAAAVIDLASAYTDVFGRARRR